MNQPILLILPLLLFYNFFMTQPILLTCLPALFLIFFMTQLSCSSHSLHPLYFFPKRPLISLSSSISTHSTAPTMLPCILPTPTVPLYQSYFLRIPSCQPFPRSRSRSRSPPRPFPANVPAGRWPGRKQDALASRKQDAPGRPSQGPDRALPRPPPPPGRSPRRHVPAGNCRRTTGRRPDRIGGTPCRPIGRHHSPCRAIARHRTVPPGTVPPIGGTTCRAAGSDRCRRPSPAAAGNPRRRRMPRPGHRLAGSEPARPIGRAAGAPRFYRRAIARRLMTAAGSGGGMPCRQ